MIKNQLSISVLLIFLMISMISCNKEDDAETPPIHSISAADVTETGFKINWINEDSDFQSIRLEVSKMNTFLDIKKTYNITDMSISSQVVDGLDGATKYYFRLIGKSSDVLEYTTDIFSETTKYTSETISISTPDGMTLSGKLSYLSYLEEPQPGIIFMHEMGVWVNNWKSAEVVKNLIAEGYVCLVFDFRGHGNSTPLDDIGILIDDWSLVATDLSSAIEFLQNQSRVDENNLALVGGSLGACMAIAGNGYEEVKTSVALSGSKNGIFQLFPEMTIQNALYIVGENDIHDSPSVNFPEESEYMYNLTADPRKLTIVDGSSMHGTDLLTSTGINEAIVEWVNAGFGK